MEHDVTLIATGSEVGLVAEAAAALAKDGINAAVVGILLAALYNPIWTSAILAPLDFALALAAFGLLQFWKLPPWLVVLLTALAATALDYLPG